MRTTFVIVCHPCFRQFSHIMEGAEDVCIKHRPAVASVEAVDYAVLCRVARLDIDAAFQLLNGLHHLTLCVYFSFHRRKSNDFV